MFTDPMSVTYNSVAKSLVRTSVDSKAVKYVTADGEFSVLVEKPQPQRNEDTTVSIELIRRIPDATPSNAFDAYREIRNAFKLTYTFDTTRAETSVDIPLLRTALLALVDSTFQGRLIAGEM